MNESTQRLLNSFAHQEQDVAGFFSRYSRHFGLLLGALSGICFSACTLFVRLAAPVNPILILWVRAALQSIISFCFVVYSKSWKSINDKKEAFFIFLNSIFVTGTVYASFSAAQMINVADLNAIVFSSPLLVAVLAYIFLKEPFGFLKAFAVLLAVIGSTFSARPQFIFCSSYVLNSKKMLGNVLAVFSSVMVACYYIAIRKLCHIPTFFILATSFVFLHLSDYNLERCNITHRAYTAGINDCCSSGRNYWTFDGDKGFAPGESGLCIHCKDDGYSILFHSSICVSGHNCTVLQLYWRSSNLHWSRHLPTLYKLIMLNCYELLPGVI